ncbi:hypothetical protein NC651_018539 [Populus alba x Populus x berolinensis]|nr:hypothetical protein NC651_018539 [Populus alba x Populus x berolinensis]
MGAGLRSPQGGESTSKFYGRGGYASRGPCPLLCPYFL